MAHLQHLAILSYINILNNNNNNNGYKKTTTTALKLKSKLLRSYVLYGRKNNHTIKKQRYNFYYHTKTNDYV